MILIGTSGYSYDDWKGRFYPPSMSSSDMLNFYSKYFNTAEINSTYYRIPPPQMFERMLEKVPQDFLFTIKAYKGITHERDERDKHIEGMNRSIKPLIQGGRCACLLLQFPYSFKAEDENKDYLKSLASKFPVPLVVEFRNDSWADESTFQLLERLNLGYCCTDEPDVKGLMPRTARVTSDVGYIRFHSRDRNMWFSKANPTDRYNYLYKEEELKEWVPKINAMKELTKTLFIFFNNHPDAQAVQNASMLARLLGKAIDIPEADDYDRSLNRFM